MSCCIITYIEVYGDFQQRAVTVCTQHNMSVMPNDHTKCLVGYLEEYIDKKFEQIAGVNKNEQT